MVELTNKQKDSFFQTGFFILPFVFNSDEISDMKNSFQALQKTAFSLANLHLERLKKQKETYIMHQGSQFVLGQIQRGTHSGQPAIRRVSWCGAAEPTLLRYGKDPRLLSVASQLLGSKKMSQLINQAHFKLPGDEVFFEWHQDSTHRGYGGKHWQDINGQGSYVQTLIALDEITSTNGPVCFIPNSVKLGHLDLPENLNNCLATGKIRLEDAIPIEMQEGSLAVFHPYVIHGSEPNHSKETRQAFINGYAYPGANARKYPGEGAGRIVVSESA